MASISTVLPVSGTLTVHFRSTSSSSRVNRTSREPGFTRAVIGASPARFPSTATTMDPDLEVPFTRTFSATVSSSDSGAVVVELLVLVVVLLVLVLEVLDEVEDGVLLAVLVGVELDEVQIGRAHV